MRPDRVISVEARGERTVLCRLAAGADLIPGLLEACERHRIQSGYISCLIGSLRSASFVYLIPDPAQPLGARYGPAKEKDGPFELVSAQGTIGLTASGERSLHIHGVLADGNAAFQAGHFNSRGNIVLVTVEAALRAVEGLRLIRDLDAETGYTLFTPRNGG